MFTSPPSARNGASPKSPLDRGSRLAQRPAPRDNPTEPLPLATAVARRAPYPSTSSSGISISSGSSSSQNDSSKSLFSRAAATAPPSPPLPELDPLPCEPLGQLDGGARWSSSCW